jgi:hypothetical protein
MMRQWVTNLAISLNWDRAFKAEWMIRRQGADFIRAISSMLNKQAEYMSATYSSLIIM